MIVPEQSGFCTSLVGKGFQESGSQGGVPYCIVPPFCELRHFIWYRYSRWGRAACGALICTRASNTVNESMRSASTFEATLIPMEGQCPSRGEPPLLESVAVR